MSKTFFVCQFIMGNLLSPINCRVCVLKHALAVSVYKHLICYDFISLCVKCTCESMKL